MRKAEMTDLNSIINIERTAYVKPYWNENSFKNLLKNNLNNSVWLFEIENKIIGFLIDQCCDNEISLLNVAVLKSLQKKGLGKKIISHYLNNIPKNSIVFLEVNKNNFIARKIYTDLNFKKVYIRKNYYNGSEDAIVMKYVK